ncbi:MAG: VIT1/CCC1 transporter family protein [Promethearchaeota archaeon]
MSKKTKPKKRIEHWKVLWEISEAGPIIRRYFVMNFFDGILTALGIVLAGFAFFIANSSLQTSGYLFFSGLTTAIAIGISGLTGSHLAESAERSLNVIQMKQVLGLIDAEGNEQNNDSNEPKYSEHDIELALGRFEKISSFSISKKTPRQKWLKKPIKLDLDFVSKNITEKSNKLEKLPQKKKKNSNKESKTIFEEAQEFAGKIAAFVDGFSPFAGVIIVVLPFLFGNPTQPATLLQYIVSFCLSIIVLFLLGSFLAKLSRESILKFGLQMVFAAIFTGVLTVFFNWLLNSRI